MKTSLSDSILKVEKSPFEKKIIKHCCLKQAVQLLTQNCTFFILQLCETRTEHEQDILKTKFSYLHILFGLVALIEDHILKNDAC